MPRHVMLMLSNPVDGMEDEYLTWYNDRHIGELLDLEGFSSAQRFKVADVRGSRIDDPHSRWNRTYRYLNLMEIYDVERAVAALSERANERDYNEGNHPDSHLYVSDALSPDYRGYMFSAITDKLVIPSGSLVTTAR